MKEYLLELAASRKGFNAKLNAMREYLQAYLLKVLHEDGFFRGAAFIGGTALRFLHGLPRFSEDLDFSTAQGETKSFVEIVTRIKREMAAAGYNVSISYNDKKTVQYAMIQCEGLLSEAGISPHPEQKLSVKIEIDTNPPAGASLETHVVNQYFPLAFLSYDTPSLFAGKLHALLNRKYTKGRDFFDVGWYLSRWRGLAPNMALLRNALEQTGWKAEFPTANNWRNFLYEVVRKADWEKVTLDVQNFLEDPADMNVFTQPNVLKLIQGSLK